MNQTLSEAIEQFSKWRKDKRGKKKIPDERWQLACDSSDELDIGSVARILRLNPDQLSLRVKARSGSSSRLSPRVVPFPEPESFVKTEPVESIVVAEALNGHADVQDISRSYLAPRFLRFCLDFKKQGGRHDLLF